MWISLCDSSNLFKMPLHLWLCKKNLYGKDFRKTSESVWRFESVHGFASVGNLYQKMHFAGSNPATGQKTPKCIYKISKNFRVEKSESGFIPFARSATSLGVAHIIAKHIICTECNIVHLCRGAAMMLSWRSNDVACVARKWCCVLRTQMKKSWKHSLSGFFGGDSWNRTNDLMHVKHAL